MQMTLAGAFGIFYPLLQNLLCLFNELAVQINCVGIDSSDSIVLAKDEV